MSRLFRPTSISNNVRPLPSADFILPLLTECRSATCSYNLSCPPQCGLSSLPPADIEDHIDDCDSRTNAEEPQQHCPSTRTTATLIRHHRRVVTRTTATLIRHYRGVVSRLHV